MKFADAGFIQEGWGAQFPWRPDHVTTIRFQSQHKAETYDDCLDDLYFVR